MMNLYIFLCLALTSFYSFASEVATKLPFERVIKNQSDKTWVIVNRAFEGERYSKFDSNPHVPKVCQPYLNRLKNICVLGPGKTVFIEYIWAGELFFIETNQNFKVTYNISHDPKVWVNKNPAVDVYNDDITIR